MNLIIWKKSDRELLPLTQTGVRTSYGVRTTPFLVASTTADTRRRCPANRSALLAVLWCLAFRAWKLQECAAYTFSLSNGESSSRKPGENWKMKIEKLKGVRIFEKSSTNMLDIVLHQVYMPIMKILHHCDRANVLFMERYGRAIRFAATKGRLV